MKDIITLAFAVAAIVLGLVMASPTNSPGSMEPLELQVASSDPGLNGQRLSSSGGVVGVHEGVAALQVYASSTSRGGCAACSALHGMATDDGVGAVDEDVVLVGNTGFFGLELVRGPAGHPWPDGVSADWTSFALEADGSLQTALGGRWIAIPGGSGDWKVKLWDGKCIILETYQPVTINYVKV